MPAILDWIRLNPQATKAYLVSLLALIGKLILAISGKAAELGPWTDFVNQFVDLLVGGLTIYGLVSGTVHASRGPAETTTDQTTEIIKAIDNKDPVK